MIAAYKCGGYDVGAVEQLTVDLYFQCGGTVTQTAHTVAYPFAFIVTAAAGFAAQQPQFFTDTP